ncbi:single-stranded-DNA-specific exonuclease RecJ [Fulvivirgaceae bacterium BMA10]|uniref:Single-stranded-DNA-specific exonuclease RecJ n=1 Tax=Splendidivirga corallicola TaxID=3051826 RepID=A0ABT8KPP2_9BACT|nr:single-stranded-DNA-specific exonuclease RecJ [Fulvivirgaceae bacterium BMA10]
MVHNWIYKVQPEEEEIRKLSTEINVNPILSSLLIQRNLKSFEDARKYFRPSLEMLHDPFLMKDMEKAVERIKTAIKRNEKILVYGDYDVDGTTAVAVFYDFLKSFYEHVDFYIPDRYTEGYGVSRAGIEWAAENGFQLIVSLDCGIKAVDKVALAKSKGIDFIVCDHHRPGEILPNAHAILDPKRADCQYPFKELSGCGVGFKLLQAICIEEDINVNKLYEYLDLLAISIASDIVPIVGENRVLAHFGLIKLNKKPMAGVQALIEIAGLSDNLDISSIVFSIGPRINAAGRIGHAKASVELLISKNEDDTLSYAKKIDDQNSRRRGYDTDITEEAIRMIENGEHGESLKSTVLFKNDWHKGVIGIVASRCMEKYYRPTIILTESNKKATGSARSVLGFDIYEAISECSDLLDQYGGHRYAAGLTLELENVAAFQKKFQEVVARNIKEEQLIPTIEIDQKIGFSQINYRFYNILKQMNPFGPENMRPVFATHNVYAVNRPKIMKEQHLKFMVAEENSENQIEAIGFGFAEYFDLINSGMRFKIAYTIEENNFMSNRYLQLYLKDIKFD